MTMHGFTLPRLDGGILDLGAYRGSVLLIANTASRCGFTPQYAGLQRLWEEYRDRGLVVIGVPSNDFGGQEPGTEGEIGAFCQKNYGVTFPMAGKAHVAGNDATPLFAALGRAGGLLARPRWNFYKYVVDRDGSLQTWFSSVTSPRSRRVRRAIEQALGRGV